MSNLIKVDFTQKKHSCIPIEKLALVQSSVIDASDKFESPITKRNREYTEHLTNKFAGLLPWVTRTSCFGANLNEYDVTFSFFVHKDDFVGGSDRKHTVYMQGLTIDVNNYLYRKFDIPAIHPSIEVSRANKHGYKQIKFKYYAKEITDDVIADLKKRNICSNY